MQNFHFHNPTEIFFGDNSLENLSPSIQSDKILLLYGSGSIKKNGTYEKVIKNLAGKNIIEFPGITPNPEFEQAMQAVKQLAVVRLSIALNLSLSQLAIIVMNQKCSLTAKRPRR